MIKAPPQCPAPYACSPTCQVGGDTTDSLYISSIPAAWGAPNQGQGDQAYIMIMTALVQLMTPGLAFFYGGMVGQNSVVSTMMLSFGTMGVVTILWVIIGYIRI